jgi:hypothetical protein
MNQPKSIVDNKFAQAKQVAGGGEPPDNELSTEHRMTALETRLDTILPTLATKADIHQAVGETHKWMIATVIGLFLGFGGLFLAMSNALKPSPMLMQPQPIIIQVPVAPQK